MIKTPKHIQEELDTLIDELRLEEGDFDEINVSNEAKVVRNSYSIKIELSPFRRRKYFVMKRTTYDFDGVKANHEAARYLVEPTSLKTFQTFEL